MFLLALALCTLSSPAPASERQSVFTAKKVTSPSGAWSLYFEPHVTNGYRGADYRMSVKQSGGSTRVAWKGTRAFTLRDPIVDDRGWVYGWAIVRAPAAQPGEPGTLHILALDESGAARLEEQTVQEVHGGGCTLPGPSGPEPRDGPVDPYSYSPRIAELIHIPSADRLIARSGSYVEEWWIFDPTAGLRTTQFVPFPHEPMKSSTHVQFTLLVRETPLVLAHASRIDWGSRKYKEDGFRESWALFDLEGRRVWSFDDVDDTRIKNFYEHMHWEDALVNRSSSTAAGRFSFFMSRTGETVSKQVQKGEDGKWIVTDASPASK